MATDNLLQQMVKYTDINIPLTGNPEITYFASLTTGLKFRRHTHFSYGMVNISPDSVTIHNLVSYSLFPPYDMLMKIIILMDKFEDLIKMDLFIGNDTISITPEYLQIYDIICDKIIHKTETKCIISFNPVNLLYSTWLPNARFYTGLPVIIAQKLKIDIHTNSSNKENINLKLQCCMLDSEERQAFAKNCNLKNPKILQMIHQKEINNTYNLIQNNLLPFSCLGIKIPDIESLESIEININQYKIILTANIIKIYDKIFNDIIYKYNDEYFIIKIKSIIMTQNPLTIYNIKINCKNHIINDNIFTCLNIHDANKNSHLLTANDKFVSYFKEYSFDIDKPQNIITESYPYHIKEIIIFFKSETEIKRIAKKITIKIDNIANEYTDLDCDIYQHTHHIHKEFDPNIYTIGYSLLPEHVHPNGVMTINKEPIIIEYDFYENVQALLYKAHILIFGYYVEKN